MTDQTDHDARRSPVLRAWGFGVCASIAAIFMRAGLTSNVRLHHFWLEHFA